MAVENAGVEELGVISFNLHGARTFVPTVQCLAALHRCIELQDKKSQSCSAEPRQLILRDCAAASPEGHICPHSFYAHSLDS